MRRCGVVAFLSLLFIGGEAVLADAPAQRLRVVASFLPVYCFAANVAGDRAEVASLLPANVSPHDYQFSRRDLEKINRADLVLVNGLGLETWLTKLLRNTTRPVKVVEITAGLEPYLITEMPHLGGNSGHGDGHEHKDGANSHTWLDPRLGMLCVSNIVRALREADPRNATYYETNGAAYLARLTRLDTEIEGALAPLKNTPIVTYHDAFPYFARRYGLRVVGVIEEIPDVGPLPRYLAELRRVIREQGVKVIFTETQHNARMPKQIGRDLRVPVAALDTLESGELSPASYEEGMRRNLKVITQSLSNHAPLSSSR